MISATVIASLFGKLNIYTIFILIQSLREMWKYIKGKDIYFKSTANLEPSTQMVCLDHLREMVYFKK